jgi:hypothetical protein
VEVLVQGNLFTEQRAKVRGVSVELGSEGGTVVGLVAKLSQVAESGEPVGISVYWRTRRRTVIVDDRGAAGGAFKGMPASDGVLNLVA